MCEQESLVCCLLSVISESSKHTVQSLSEPIIEIEEASDFHVDHEDCDQVLTQYQELKHASTLDHSRMHRCVQGKSQQVKQLAMSQSRDIAQF